MSEYTQSGRPMRVDTALGEDVLLLERFQGVEAISRPFSYEVGLLSIEDSLEPDDLLRTPMLLTVQGVADEP
ncbi:MAG TPA: hypothetical protein VE173_06445, partial [Longimicrobiales bacterium]|nr:hypothetical protein [Longimicrobiales bacterium]